MKKIITITLLALALFLAAGKAVLAGGDKVHGDKAAGDPPQYCLEPGLCPWEN